MCFGLWSLQVTESRLNHPFDISPRSPQNRGSCVSAPPLQRRGGADIKRCVTLAWTEMTASSGDPHDRDPLSLGLAYLGRLLQIHLDSWLLPKLKLKINDNLQHMTRTQSPRHSKKQPRSSAQPQRYTKILPAKPMTLKGQSS